MVLANGAHEVGPEVLAAMLDYFRFEFPGRVG
jgi:hypothetical protein